MFLFLKCYILVTSTQKTNEHDDAQFAVAKFHTCTSCIATYILSQKNPISPISFRFSLILASHLGLGLQSDCFPSSKHRNINILTMKTGDRPYCNCRCPIWVAVFWVVTRYGTDVSEDHAASVFILKKRWYPTTTLHGIRTQKTSTWIFIAVKTSNLALVFFF
jgi:hypothetical protein